MSLALTAIFFYTSPASSQSDTIYSDSPTFCEDHKLHYYSKRDSAIKPFKTAHYNWYVKKVHKADSTSKVLHKVIETRNEQDSLIEIAIASKFLVGSCHSGLSTFRPDYSTGELIFHSKPLSFLI